MKLLLDTHVFIWWTTEPSKLSATAAAAFLDPANELWLSVVSAWEMQIKLQSGKLKFFAPFATLLQGQIASNNLRILPVQLTHVQYLDIFPYHHRDPFDRLLVAQSACDGYTLVTKDQSIVQYGINTLW